MILSDIRKSAREALAGKWGKGALIVLAYFAFTFALGFVSGLVENVALLSLIVDIATFIITIPISFSLIASFIKLKRGEDVRVFEFITYGFNNFKRAWKIAGNILLKLWLPILLYLLSIIFITLAGIGIYGAAASAISGYISSSFVGFAGITSIIGFILFIISFIYMFVKSLLYSLAYLVAYDNENMSGKEIVEESKKLMTGNRCKYLLLQLSFIGWAILTVFTLYIGMLWLVPYMQVAMVCFYEALKDKKVEE